MSISTNKKRPFRPAPFTLLIVFLAGLGTAHILVRTATYGPSVHPDSVVFLSTALNFLAGEGWREFTGGLTAEWPPFFPLLMVVGGWVGIEPLEVGRWVNATAFGLTILVAGCWLRLHLRARWLTLAASVVILTSLSLSELASAVMNEPLFVLFTLLALMQLAAFLQRGERTSLLWAAVCTALAVLTRYPGVVLIGAGVLMLLVRRAPPLVARLKDAVVFGAIPSIPLAVERIEVGWQSRYQVVFGAIPSIPLFDSLSRVVDVFREWVMPQDAVDWFDYLLWRVTGLSTSDGFGSLLWATTGLVVVAMVVVVVLSGRGVGRGGQSPPFGLGPVLPFAVFAAIYLVFIVAIVLLVYPLEMSARYLLPVYGPLLLTAVFLLDRFLSIEVAGWVAAAKWGLASLVLLGAFAHIGFSAQKNLRLTAQALEPGYPGDGALNVAYRQHAATLKYLRDHLSDSITYSNNHFLLWFADRTAAIRTHRQLPFEISGWWTRKASGWRKSGRDEVYIVWLKGTYRTVYYDYNDLDIRLLPGVEVVAEASDGVVFRVRVAATEPFDADRHRARKHLAQERYVAHLLAQAGERVVRADWDVYRNGRKLTYFKQPCAAADVQAKFVLHVVPADSGVLPIARRRWGSDNLDFHFDWLDLAARVQVADQCVATVRLPAYAIDRVYVGQWISKENRTVWEAEFSPGR